jgi:hypothetical protein
LLSTVAGSLSALQPFQCVSGILSQPSIGGTACKILEELHRFLSTDHFQHFQCLRRPTMLGSKKTQDCLHPISYLGGLILFDRFAEQMSNPRA